MVSEKFVFDEAGWHVCVLVTDRRGMLRIQNPVLPTSQREADNEWLKPDAARSLALGLLAAAIRAEDV